MRMTFAECPRPGLSLTMSVRWIDISQGTGPQSMETLDRGTGLDRKASEHANCRNGRDGKAVGAAKRHRVSEQTAAEAPMSDGDSALQ
jgi:hypothetical protein